MLEKDDEEKYVSWCKGENLICEKVKFVQAGYPDRITVLPISGKPLWIEFKRENKEPELIQLYRIAELRKSGGFAGWTDDSRIAIYATKALLDATRVSAPSHKIIAIAIRWGLVFGPGSWKDQYVFGSTKDLKGQRAALKMFDHSTVEAYVQSMAGRNGEVE